LREDGFIQHPKAVFFEIGGIQRIERGNYFALDMPSNFFGLGAEDREFLPV
jgi:hypothetical protein